jgi:hypothetical protein
MSALVSQDTLKQPTTNEHSQSRGRDDFDSCLYFDPRNRHAHRIVNARRPADQPHGSGLRLILPTRTALVGGASRCLANHRYSCFDALAAFAAHTSG